MYISYGNATNYYANGNFKENRGLKGYVGYIFIHFGSLRGRAKGFISQIKPLRCGVHTYMYTLAYTNDDICHFRYALSKK